MTPLAAIAPQMRGLSLLLALVLAGCASGKKVDQQLDPATANTRALEQMRMRAVTSGDAGSQRGAEVMQADKDKVFNFSARQFGGSHAMAGQAARTNPFNFVDRVRTKDFASKAYVSKSAWLGDAKFATKAARTNESWFAKRSASTKGYETRAARDASKTAPTRAVPGGDRAYVLDGRRQADLDSTGRSKIPFGTTDMGPSWSGDLKPLTIEDVKGLLNKN